ncbi:MAG: WYL domain-containing protein [Verrucomicrobia bacterium]|nr:WYL domain-containing protein [Verrucomicrobiota bacterium]
MKPNKNKKKRPVPQTRFFSLLEGRLEDALLIYSNMIDEPIEVDPALDTLTNARVTFIPFPTQPPYAQGLAEIEEALLKQMGVVIRRRDDGKVIAEPKTGPSKGTASRRPSAKPLHEIVLHALVGCPNEFTAGRWPGEQSRQRLEDGTLELHLQVPNLDAVVTWLAGTCFEVRAVSPEELRDLLREAGRRIVESHSKRRKPDSDDSFAA